MSVRQEVLQILADAAEPLTSLAIFDLCKEASGRPIVSQTLSMLKADEYVEPAGKSEVEGETALVLWQITAEGRAELKALVAAEYETGGGGPKEKGKRQKAKVARRAKRRHKVHKVQRRNAKKVLRRRSGQVSREAPVRWALTSGGTFVLLGAREPLEIAQSVARELLGLVRAGADLPGLAAFIEKLDQGQA